MFNYLCFYLSNLTLFHILPSKIIKKLEYYTFERKIQYFLETVKLLEY